MKPIKEFYTKEDVINIIDGIFEMPDMINDMLNNENTQYSTDNLFDIVEANTKFEKTSQLTAGGIIALKERQRQIEVEGYDTEHDSKYKDHQLALAGACYALPHEARGAYQSLNTFYGRWFPRWWPWQIEFWKPTPENRIKELGKAAALIIAEIDYQLTKKK